MDDSFNNRLTPDITRYHPPSQLSAQNSNQLNIVNQNLVAGVRKLTNENRPQDNYVQKYGQTTDMGRNDQKENIQYSPTGSYTQILSHENSVGIKENMDHDKAEYFVQIND